ncbi:MAG: hypothetical protein QOD90_2511, partial [Mycobacterium sp.]|nr:hypothetical protein [Mycobacterium sp.]
MTSTRPATWVGALTLTVGMALASGANIASADDTDSTDSAPSASTSSGVGGGEEPAQSDSSPAGTATGASTAAGDASYDRNPTASSTTGQTDNDGPTSKVGSEPTSSVAKHVGVGEEPAAPEGATPAKVAEPTTAAKVAEPTTTATVAEPATPGAEAGIAATAEPAALATAAPAEDSAPTPAAANDSEPSIGPAPRTDDMSFQNPPREDRYSDGGWSFQVAPQDPGVTITATTASGTVTQTGRFYMLSTGNPDGYNFTWTPTNPGDTPQDVVFTATRPDGTT